MWRKVALSPLEVSLDKVLRCGQTFRWKNINDTWSFTTKDRIVLLKQDNEHLHYAHVLKKGVSDSPKQLELTRLFVHDYFNLLVKLEELYDQWRVADAKYRKRSDPFSTFTGIRILRQDPWETLISFICSSNNNVKRISKMCDTLVNEFGDYVNEHDGIKYYAFPEHDALAAPEVETRLRDLGFGYRAKFIQRTALMFADPEFPDITIEQLHRQRDLDYELAHEFLLQLCGVGPKVADCICLMALDKHDIVPIDTHVYQIATRDYKFKGGKTMNKQLYHEMRLFFKGIFGEYAGWAQSVLFTSDLSDLNNGINVREKKEETKEVLKIEETEMKIEETGKVETVSLVKEENTVSRDKRRKIAV